MVEFRKITTFIVLSLCVLFVNAQNVKVISSGQGITEDEATKIALRSALEDAYGTFISSSTKIENDVLISDEIVSLTQGNIIEYDIINSSKLKNGIYSVLVESIVSLSKLSSYCVSKGMSVNFNGNTLAMNHSLQKNNEINEEKIIKNLSSIFVNTIESTNLYDYQIKKTTHWGRKITFKILVEENENGKILSDLLFNTVNRIKLNRKERIELSQLGFECFEISAYNQLYLTPIWYLTSPLLGWFLLADKNYKEVCEDGMSGCYAHKKIIVRSSYTARQISNIISTTWNKEMFKFKIIDNNNKEYCYKIMKIRHKKIRSKKIDSDNEFFNRTSHILTVTLKLTLDEMRNIDTFKIVPL